MKHYEIHYEQAYCSYFDITIIRKFTLCNDVSIKEEISGFYYGEPDLSGLETFKEKNYLIMESESGEDDL